MTATSSLSLDHWTDLQAKICAENMAQAVSATSLVKHRPYFGQTVHPARGSVVAAIGSANSETEPDYFFHWLRDSAAVMDGALVLIRRGIDAGAWRRRFAEFVQFSLDLGKISGPRFSEAEPDLVERTAPEFRQFLRPSDEIAAVEGERVLGEVRYNADGALDFLRWSRPQDDGPAARALTCLRYINAGAVDSDIQESVETLLRIDLNYTAKHGGAPCYDIWEEEFARHYYTGLVQFAALQKGARWANAIGDADFASTLDAAARNVGGSLDHFWSEEQGFYRSRIMQPGQTTTKELDFAVILGVLHAETANGRHSVEDDRVAITLQRMEELFRADYAINREAGAGVAFGRYRNDSYFSGGAYFFCTLGAAEFYYRLAVVKADPSLIAKGDSILEMARAFIPASGEISEQFDQTTGEQTSAKGLTWSYAAFVTAWNARQIAMAA